MPLPVSAWARQPGYTGDHGPWYVNADSGELTHQTGPLALLAGFFNQAFGWYGFKTEAEAQNALKTVTGKTATTSVGKGLHNELNQGTQDVGGALGLPTFKNTRGFVARAFKVIVGLGLIIVGFIQLTHAQTLVKSAAQAAGAIA